MKFIYTLTGFFLFAAFSASAAEMHIVTQTGTAYNPVGMIVNVGDTIRWEWTGGNHTTTSVMVPAGAGMWDEPLNSINPSFEYIVQAAGDYVYVCTPHQGMGMGGGFIAEEPSQVKEAVVAPVLTVSMDSQNNELFLNLTSGAAGYATIEMIDISGRVISILVNEEISGAVSLKKDVSTLVRGIYFIHLKMGDRELTKKFIKG